MHLRALRPADLEHFFRHETDPEAIRMAAFVADDPHDRAAFDAHWARIGANPRVTIRTIELDGAVVGHVASFDRGDEREVTFWIDRAHWGRGVATAALAQFLDLDRARPLHARVAHDNIASRRVLEKCGFALLRTERGFANARGAEIEELVLVLAEPPGDPRRPHA